MSSRYPYGSQYGAQKSPVRTAMNDGMNAMILVFVGSLVVGFINRSMGVAINVNPPKNEETPPPVV